MTDRTIGPLERQIIDISATWAVKAADETLTRDEREYARGMASGLSLAQLCVVDLQRGAEWAAKVAAS